MEDRPHPGTGGTWKLNLPGQAPARNGVGGDEPLGSMASGFRVTPYDYIQHPAPYGDKAGLPPARHPVLNTGTGDDSWEIDTSACR